MGNTTAVLTPDEQRRAVKVWAEAAGLIERMRNQRLAGVDTAMAIEALAGAYAIAASRNAPRPGSGLVEQQAWFARAHDRSG